MTAGKTPVDFVTFSHISYETGCIQTSYTCQIISVRLLIPHGCHSSSCQQKNNAAGNILAISWISKAQHFPQLYTETYNIISLQLLRLYRKTPILTQTTPLHSRGNTYIWPGTMNCTILFATGWQVATSGTSSVIWFPCLSSEVASNKIYSVIQ